MTNAQKIRLRLSQVRQRLNEIAGVEGVRCEVVPVFWTGR